jgi:DHA2 family multidrug resistance protein
MRIDVVGIVLLAIGLTALQILLERGERENWFDSSFIVTTGLIALVALLLLVGWELWVEEPVVNLRILKNLRFTAGTCLGFVFGITLFGSLFILPLFLQRLRGYSVLDSSLIQMPRMLIMFVVTPIAGRLYNYVDGRLLIGAGVAMMILGYFDLARLTLEVGPAELLPGFLLTGAGMVVHVWYYVGSRHAHSAPTHADRRLWPEYSLSPYWWQYWLCPGDEPGRPSHRLPSGASA